MERKEDRMRGFRVVGLTPYGEIPDEFGEIHHFSLSRVGAEWWARALPLDNSVESRGYEISRYGYAIMEVEAEEVKRDHFFPDGEDFFGRITFARPVRVVNYVEQRRRDEQQKQAEEQRRKQKKRTFWRKLLSILFLHLFLSSEKNFGI